MNVTEAARVLGIDPQTARHAYKFGIRGWKVGQPDPNQGLQERAFRNTKGAEVARRRDELDQPFHVIAEAMGVTRETARKAYLRHHRLVAEETGQLERLNDLGCNRQMSLTKLWRVRKMLQAGHTVNQIASEVGCSKGMVYREKRKQLAE
ncbi:MAG: helix-turn-helix domain-containing protein [Phycisphaerales bacterium]